MQSVQFNHRCQWWACFCLCHFLVLLTQTPPVGALPLVLPLLGYTWCLGIRFVAVTVGFETPLLLVHLDEGNWRGRLCVYVFGVCWGGGGITIIIMFTSYHTSIEYSSPYSPSVLWSRPSYIFFEVYRGLGSGSSKITHFVSIAKHIFTR